MSAPPPALLPAMWLAWAGYWALRAADAKPTARREGMLSRALHLVPLAIAFALVVRPGPTVAALDARFVPPLASVAWIGAVLTLGGLLFAVQARRRLGRNWSGTVTVKEGHGLVTDGPYGVVRHPIYTGLLAAFFGTALALGQWRGLLATGLVLVAFVRKIRLEERWMGETFGDAYDAYRRRVPALVPGLW